MRCWKLIGTAGALVVAVVGGLVSCSGSGRGAGGTPSGGGAGAGTGRGGEPAAAVEPRAKGVPEVVPATVRRGVVTEMDMTTFFALKEAGRLSVYDVRPGFYYRMGHIPGAVNFPRMGFDQHFGEMKAGLDAAVAAGRVVVLYCTDVNCPDGRVVGEKLAEKGYTVSVYKGGWEEWKAAGLPVE